MNYRGINSSIGCILKIMLSANQFTRRNVTHMFICNLLWILGMGLKKKQGMQKKRGYDGQKA